MQGNKLLLMKSNLTTQCQKKTRNQPKPILKSSQFDITKRKHTHTQEDYHREKP